MMAPASGARDGRGFIDERYYENVPGMSRGEAKAAAEAAAAAAAAAEEQSGFGCLPPAGNDPNEAPYNGEGRSAAEDLAKLTGVPPKKLSKIDTNPRSTR
jgi:hypothetical protein